ncbi:hypothetical protein [Nocardiopsis sp. EMB25]|uniref:hypothetical protein n=1 Tax=Nocardiopsis sp. EMB25 TaxID=2835867 RepID=UPI003FA3D5BC
MRWRRAIGVAAFVGVAATGVVIARAERRRRAYTPDQVRERLRERVARIEAEGAPDLAPPPRTLRERVAGRCEAVARSRPLAALTERIRGRTGAT